MNKKILISMVVAGLVVIGVIAYLLTNKNDDSNNNNAATNNQSATTQTENTDQPTKSTVNALLADNKNRQCTFSYDDNGEKASGTAYFSGGEKMRMNYKSEKSGTNYDGGMVITSGNQKIWDNTTKKGFELNLTNTNQDSNQTQQGFDKDKDINFNCKNWTVDQSVFTPPSDISFTNLSDLQIPTTQ